MPFGNMLIRKFSFAHTEAKSNCLSHIVTQFMDVLFGVTHQNSIRKLTVSF